MLWLVTTPKQAQLMRKAREGRSTSDVCVMSLGEAQDLFGAVGDPTPATLYEVAGWLLAPAPDEIAAVGGRGRGRRAGRRSGRAVSSPLHPI